MSDVTALIRRLVEAGTPAELVAEVAMLAAQAQADRDALEQRRRSDRERKAKSREVTGSHVTGRDSRDTPNSPLPLSPEPPNSNPPLTPHSEANASGAAAPNVVALGDPRGELFSRGLKAVMAMTGKAEPQARTMLGRWLQLVSDEALFVLHTIDEAVDHRPANPTAWIEGALRKRKTGPPAGGFRRPAEGFL